MIKFEEAKVKTHQFLARGGYKQNENIIMNIILQFLPIDPHKSL